MIHRHERGILNRYLTSVSTQARHQAKLLSLLDWINRFGYTSTSVIEILWNVDRSVVNRLIRRYVRDDVINEVPTFACRDRRVFLLKPKGVRLLEELHDEQLTYSIKPSTLNFKIMTHDLMCSAIVALGVQENKYRFFVTEKEQAIEGMGKNRRFDALVFETDTAELVGIEMEASSKTIPHRLDALRRIEKSIRIDNKVSRCLYYSHRRRFLVDAERIHQKLYDKPENELDEVFFKQHVKLVFNKEIISMLYHKFWLH